MSLRHPSRVTCSVLKIASIGLAGLLAGCNSNTTGLPHNDTDWQTSSTYASATAALPARNAQRSAHPHPCLSGPCAVHAQTQHSHSLHHI
jgi:hypothetical protein